MTETVIIAEMNKGKVSSTTNELIGAANLLGSNCTLVVPCTDSSVADEASNISGVTKIIAAKSSVFTNYDASGWAQALDSVAPQGIIVTSASAQSKDLAARIASRRNISVVQDVIAIDGNTLSTPIYSGKAIEHVSINGNVVVSIRPNVFAGTSNDGSCEVQVIDASGDLSTAVKELVERASTRLDVSEANIIISGGRGMGSPDNFSHLEVIADTLGAAVGASRAAVDPIVMNLYRGHKQGDCGDVLLVLNPGWMNYGRTGTTHGSPFAYDTHVPCLFYGAGVESGETYDKTYTRDVAPTMSALLGIPYPNGTTGSPIHQALK